MTISEDFRTFILSDPDIAAIVDDRVGQNKIPQGDAMPAIWFRRGTSNDGEIEMAIGDRADVQWVESFDVEVVSENLDQVESLAAMLKRFQRHRGTFGSGKIQGLFVDDHSDSYVKENIGGDDGRHVAALDFETVGYEVIP